MTKPKLRPVSLLRAAKEICRLGKLYPEAVYHRLNPNTPCSYTRGKVTKGPKDCGCIMGQALINCSNDPEAARNLLAKEEKKADEFKLAVQDLPIQVGLLKRAVNAADEELLTQLVGAQQIQDSGNNWGACVRFLKAHLNKRRREKRQRMDDTLPWRS